MEQPLLGEFETYLQNRDELMKDYEGRLVALKGGQVLGDFEDFAEAAPVIFAEHERGTVLFQRVSTDEHDTTIKIYAPGVWEPA